MRNKYPEIYSRIEKGSFGIKDQAQKGQGGVLEPVTSTTIEKAMSMSSGVGAGSELTLNRRSSSREDMGVPPKWANASSFYDSSSDSLPGLADVFVDMGSAGLEHQMGPAGTAPTTGAGVVLSPGEMDISRLLLDDGLHASVSGLGEQQQQQHHHQMRYGGVGGGTGGYETVGGITPEGRYRIPR